VNRVLHAWARFDGHREALVDVGTGRRWTYAELHADTGLPVEEDTGKEDTGTGGTGAGGEPTAEDPKGCAGRGSGAAFLFIPWMGWRRWRGNRRPWDVA
jgi:hypothetical protein